MYEQIPITDGVEEFCETFGLLDKEYVAQITPEWMKDSGIALFRDALNERVYITWQDQLIAVPQLAQGKLTTVSDVKVWLRQIWMKMAFMKSISPQECILEEAARTQI